MKLKFNPEAKVTEWQNGVYFKNEGAVLDVSEKLGTVMLREKHSIKPNEFINVFILAEEPAKKEKSEAK